MPLSVVFRVDASLLIGTGHVMRCLTLAEALRDRGALCRFVCRAHPGNLNALISGKRFEVIELPMPEPANCAGSPAVIDKAEYQSWLGVSGAEDALQTCQALTEGLVVDWLIVDHYALDAGWESVMRQACRRLMVIDDLANRRHTCDLLLDQNLGCKESDYADLVPQQCQVLVGPVYALLRPEFAKWRDFSLMRRQVPKLERVVVAMGGVDKDDVSSQVIEFIDKIELSSKLDVTVVLGIHAPWLEKVRQKTMSMRHQAKVLTNVDNMAELMAHSDLAVGAAGSTAWERCCLGLPSIMMVLAENQEGIASALHGMGAAKVVPAKLDFDAALAAVWQSIQNPAVLQSMSDAARSVVDGRGVDRVMSEVTSL